MTHTCGGGAMIRSRNSQIGSSPSGGGAHDMKPRRLYQVWRGGNVSSFLLSLFVLIFSS